MAPRKWADTTRDLIKEFMFQRDGPLCVICQSEDAPDKPLEIDHVDPNGGNSAFNLQLLCKKCNLDRRSFPKRPRPESPTHLAKRALPYEDGSAEMRASGWFEPKYRSWVIDHLPLARTEAINGGAEITGCSVVTATRYLAKMLSSTGPLISRQDEHGVTTIHRKGDRF